MTPRRALDQIAAHNRRVAVCRHQMAGGVLHGAVQRIRPPCRSSGYGKRGRGEVGWLAKRLAFDRRMSATERRAPKPHRQPTPWLPPTWRSALHLQEAQEWRAYDAAVRGNHELVDIL